MTRARSADTHPLIADESTANKSTADKANADKNPAGIDTPAVPPPKTFIDLQKQPPKKPLPDSD